MALRRAGGSSVAFLGFARPEVRCGEGQLEV